MNDEYRPRLAVFKFASCDGCQLSLLDCEDELLAIAERLDIVNFPEASKRMLPGPYDIALVEGSITTRSDRDRLKAVRAQSKRLICIGACATAGGIQALRNSADVGEYLQAVYPHPEYLSTLPESTPIAEVVPVDYELQGCPINKRQLLEVVLAFASGRRPQIPRENVCMECKARGNVCVMVAGGQPCLGPVTQAGCGAICTSYRRGCYGCFGLGETSELETLATYLHEHQSVPAEVLARGLQTFNSAAEPLKFVASQYASIADSREDNSEQAHGQ